MEGMFSRRTVEHHHRPSVDVQECNLVHFLESIAHCAVVSDVQRVRHGPARSMADHGRTETQSSLRIPFSPP
eukprot:390302-Rhodomonas_salina.1